MHLKSLEIHGFKSFADKTIFEFHRGVTGIVGPNGCGKSNVVDAIRWVLGETSAKALRGGEMADVIFSGTDKRKPIGMAEVILTLADCEDSLKVPFNEVALCRRVFRDGRSEYRINGTQCRLKDFQDLLAGTGIGRSAYSVMEQGKIDMLISAKPEDRRMVFEEAAGITKFKSQKKEALRKLDHTEANLLRVTDIVAEVKRQMGSLQRQAQKARRYQSILENLRILDTHLAFKQYAELTQDKSSSENTLLSLMQQMHELHQSIRSKETEVTETRESFHQVENQITELRQLSQDLRSQVQSASSKIEFNQERMEELRSRITRNQEDAEASADLLDRQREQLANADDEFASLQDLIQSRQADVDEYQAFHFTLLPERHRLESERRDLREAYRKLESESATAEAKIQNLAQQMLVDEERFQSLQIDRDVVLQEQTELLGKLDVLHQEVESLEKVSQELEQQGQRQSQLIDELRLEREQISDSILHLQSQLTQKQSRHSFVEQMLKKGEGIEHGTQAILKQIQESDSTKGPGLLSANLQVEDRFLPAIEALLEKELQSLIISNHAEAATWLNQLRDSHGGKASFLSLQSLNSPIKNEALPPSAIAWASEVVSCPEALQPMVQRLLNHVLIVESLDQAVNIAAHHPHLKLVTLSGEKILPQGQLQGGKDEQEVHSTLRLESEARHLREEVELLQKEALQKQEEAELHKIRFEEAQRQEANLRDALQQNREVVHQLQTQQAAIQRQHHQCSAKLDSLTWEQNQIQTRTQSSVALTEQHRQTLTWVQEQLSKAHERETQIEGEIDKAARKEADSTEKLNELKTALAIEVSSLQNLERQKAPLASRLEELQSAIARYENECFIWQQRIDSAENESRNLLESLEQARQQLSETEAQGHEALERRNLVFEKVSTIETELNQMRQRQTELNERKSREEVQQSRHEMRVENLLQQITERYQIDLNLFEPKYHQVIAALLQQKRLIQNIKTQEAQEEAAESSDDSNSEITAPLATPVAEEIIPDTPAEIEVDSEVQADQIDWQLVQNTVAELRKRLESIGSVNLDSIKEFEELEERYLFLETQHQDLLKSKEELIQVIAKINETTKTMFLETFKSVRDNFRQNFKELFGSGAQADLILQDDNDPLECGIEIIAKPPGKKLQSISLLSGGERSMTAVALLFSIYMVKPSPFCVLDELDAPLDESNIKRFLTMLEKFLTHSQFIIVTHNKRTMSVADVIYGVTMQEFGVSKPVGVKMTQEKASLEDNAPTVAETVSGRATILPTTA